MKSFKDPIITLTTDFGLNDPFVGIMKGVMLGINPDLRFVDLSHQIEPQNILKAAYILGASYTYFPEKTIHLVVVDPGVGSERRGIIAVTEGYTFIAPDNGVLSPVFHDKTFLKVVEITERRFALPEISSTFHGRDIFAPAAAWLSVGTDTARFGREIRDYVILDLPKAHLNERDIIEGEIIYKDRFGNLISNISQEIFDRSLATSKNGSFNILIGSTDIKKINRFYAEGGEDEVSALFNSQELLEIYIHQKNASGVLNIDVGERIRVRFNYS